MLEETLTEWWNGAVEKGRQEGRQESRQTGHLEGMRRLLLKQLEQRFETVTGAGSAEGPVDLVCAEA